MTDADRLHALTLIVSKQAARIDAMQARLDALESRKPPRAGHAPASFTATTVDAMIIQACDIFPVQPADIMQDRRTPEIVNARDWVCLESHKAGCSITSMARYMRRHHRSVGAGIEREIARRGVV